MPSQRADLGQAEVDVGLPKSNLARQAEDCLSGASPSFYKRLIDNLHDGVYFVDCNRIITYWNRGAEHLTGYTEADAVGKKCSDNFLRHVNEQGCELCLGGCPLEATLKDGESREAEVFLLHKSGHRVPVSVRVAPMADGNGQIIGAVETFSDNSAKKDVERRAEEFETLAFRDALTGVANRRYLDLKLQQAIQEVEKLGRKIGLLMIDVDYFKQVNDTYGHATGDTVLRTVCQTLAHGMRPKDIVGRWGGEEFLVLAMDVTPAGLQTLAERCRMLVAESAVLIGGKAVKVTISAGATMLQRGDSEETLFKRADELMYRGKGAGRNRAVLGSAGVREARVFPSVAASLPRTGDDQRRSSVPLVFRPS